MKKILIGLSILLLLSALAITYQKWNNDENLTVWSFVPKNALAIYESEEPLAAFKEVSQTELWENLRVIETLKNLQQHIQSFDTLSGVKSFSNHFKKNHILASLNKISSDNFDILLVVEVNSLSQHTFISKVLSEIKNNGYQLKTRKYLEFTITDITSSNSDNVFTYIYYQNYFVCSFTAFLVEDAVRSVANEDQENFLQLNSELNNLTKLQLDQGNLYLNTLDAESFLNTFTNKRNDLKIGKSSYLDIKVDQKNISLSGFTISNKTDDFLSIFNNISSGSFLMTEIIPNETAFLNHISVSDPNQFSKNLDKYLEKASPKVLEKRLEILNSIDLDVAYTYQLIDSEIGVVTLEESREDQLDKLLILQVRDMGETMKYFNSVDERRSALENDTVYVEQFGNYEIRKLPAADFGYALIGDIGHGFDQSYYLPYRNYVIISNNLQRLKSFTFSIEDENTWSKSLVSNNFLSNIDQGANLSLIVNTPRVWSKIIKALKPTWADHLDKYAYSYKNLEFLAFQFSAVDDKFYTRFTINQPELPVSKLPTEIKVQQSITLGDYANQKPYLVTNQLTKTKEIIIQDSSKSLYLLDDQFEFLWSKNINDKIKSKIYQIDYYKNNKLQYLFSTERAVHLIDRTGTYIPGFPKTLQGNERIKFFTLVDYKNTKNYRFAIAGYDGQLFLTDKDLKPVGNWTPKKYDGEIQEEFRHVRIENTDFMITLLNSGKLYVQNRKGDNRDGFPLDFGIPTTGYFIKTSNNISQSSMVLVTSIGEIIEIAMDSRLISREQIYKPATQTTFEIIPDIANETFLILRKTENKYEFLSESGELLFSKDYFATKPISIQYYRLGGDNDYVVIVDPNGSYLYLYNMSGNLITGRPLAASQPISLMKYGKELRIYRALDRNVEQLSIKF
ncbi:MAG: hypothetical protein RIA69_13585 [Cyclobacteriaceae bacterium]